MQFKNLAVTSSDTVTDVENEGDLKGAERLIADFSVSQTLFLSHEIPSVQYSLASLERFLFFYYFTVSDELQKIVQGESSDELKEVALMIRNDMSYLAENMSHDILREFSSSEDFVDHWNKLVSNLKNIEVIKIMP